MYIISAFYLLLGEWISVLKKTTRAVMKNILLGDHMIQDFDSTQQSSFGHLRYAYGKMLKTLSDIMKNI